MIKILSIDGGGIRGIIPAIVLTEIEYRTKKPISQLFHLMAGTSTGGILALGLSKPHTKDSNKPHFKAEELVNLYYNEGKRIFPPSFWSRMGLNTLSDEKYPVRGMETLLQKYFGDTLLSESLGEIIITAYELHKRDTWIFSRRLALRDSRFDFKMRDVARATSAAPTFFEPAKIKAMEGMETYYMIDGGLFANNPSMIAFVDFVKNHTKEEEKSSLMVSIGAGETIRPISYRKAKKWGLLGWAKPTIDILFSATSHAIHNQLAIIYNDRKPEYHYHRFEPRLDFLYSEMDKTTEKYLDYYAALTKRMIIERSREIDEVCKLLTG